MTALRLPLAMIAALLSFTLPGPFVAGDDSAGVLKPLRAFPWPAYRPDVGVRHDGLTILLDLPNDRARLDAVAKISKARPLRLQLDGNGRELKLDRLRNLTNVTSLVISDARLTSDQLAHIKDFPLEELTLLSVTIEGDALKHLAALPDLRHVDLGDVTMDPAQVAHIGNLKHLEHLGISFPVEDDQLRHFGKLTKLVRLTLSDAPVTDDGLRHLSNLIRMRDLAIVNARITENGIRHFERMSQLSSLSIPRVKLGDASLRQLARHKELRYLSAEYDRAEARPHLARVAWQRTANVLDRDVQMEFAETPLGDVVEFLSDAHGVPIRMDPVAVKEKAIRLSGPVTLSVRGVSLRAAIRMILRPLNLQHVVQTDHLLVTTPERAAGITQMRKYDLGRLLAVDDEASAAELRATIRTVIAPTTWNESARQRGYMRMVSTTLEVGQSPIVHEQIQGLLSELEGRGGRSAPVQARMRAALKTASSLKCKDTPLETVVDFLSDHHGVAILFDPLAIEAGELNPFAMITTDQAETTLKQQLDAMLDPLKLTWVVRHETLQITSQAQADRELQTNAYHVGDLMAQGHSASLLATRLRRILKFDAHPEWYCQVCLNRIVVRATIRVQRRSQQILQDLR